MSQLHICDIRLMQLELIPPKQHTKRQVQLCPRKIDTKTSSRAAPKRHHEPIQGYAVASHRVIQPALRNKFVRVRKNIFIVTDLRNRHALPQSVHLHLNFTHPVLTIHVPGGITQSPYLSAVPCVRGFLALSP